MENYLVALCNRTSLNVIDQKSSSSLPYFDNCFQQLFLITPTYILLLVLVTFYHGLYSKLQSSIYRALTFINWITFGRYFTVLIIILLQISITISYTVSSILVAQLTAILKIIATIVYFGFLFKCPRIAVFEKQFKLLKLYFILIITPVSLLENVTLYFEESKIGATLVFSSLCSLCWFIHFIFLIVPDQQHQFVSSLLVNEDNEEATDDNLLLCDEQESLLSQLFFGWVGPLLDRGASQQIESSTDLFVLPTPLNSLSVCCIADQYLDDPNVKRKNYLMRCLFRRFGWQLFWIGLMKLFADASSFLSPIFLNRILLFLEGDEVASYSGFRYAGALFAATFFNALFISTFNFQMSKLSLKMRTVLITIIYHKLFRVRSSHLIAQFGTGQVLNLANTDIERIVNFSPSLYQFISLPLQLVITLYLLYVEVGVVFLSAVVFILALIPLNRVICTKIGTYSTEMMKWKDKRIRLVTEILRGIRTIKMHFWENSFIEKVFRFRASEVKYLRYRKYLDALCVYFWATTPVIVSSLVFGTYAAINGTESLTSSKVFTSLALLGMLIMPLNALPWVLNGLIEALVSLRRLDRFFLLEELDLSEDYLPLQEHDRFAFQLNNCTFTYIKGNSEMADHFKLSNITLDIPQRSFTAVIGKVGSGKSSLLLSLLNEMTRVEGTIAVDPKLFAKGVGYVSQEPWVRDTSIRENILFGKQMDPELYHRVVDACALTADFKLFPNGDQTLVGNNGKTLSGGQKLRVSFARALYQDFDVYLIDEPFSSVDVKVAQEMYEKVFLKMLLPHNKCVVLATNHLNYCRDADTVLPLENGVINNEKTVDSIFQEVARNAAFSRKDSLAEGMTDVKLDTPTEEREYGLVKFDVYISYMRAVGFFVFALIVASIALMQISKTTSDFWLSYWTQNRTPQSGSSSMTYLYIFIGIAILNSVFTLIRAFIFAYGGIKAAVVLHNRLLTTVLKTSLLFFDLTAFGIIINRFSSDIFQTDDALPFTLNIFLAQVSGLAASLVVTIYGLPWILIIVLPLIIPYYFIQKYFRATSRELKRLSAVSLSPIYSLLDDTIQGLTTIRAFVQCERFKMHFYESVNVYNRIQYSINAVQQWLNLRLQLLGVVVTAAVALIAVGLHYYHTEAVNSGLIGLALVYSLSLTSLLNGSVQTFTQTEMDLISVERITQILKTIEENFGLEGAADEPSLLVDSSWPSKGQIVFNNVSMRYRPHLDLALKKVCLSIQPAEHIAIVGRTGSGKSSLFQALFRLTKLDSGSISIDGVDISMIDLEVLRSKIFIIPQDPFLFSGTIRSNLDPLDQYRDDEVWTALYNCNINILVDSLGGLDAELRENGSDLSAGTRSLFMIARAVLNKKKILCMDEVTANIDPETERVLHELVRTTLRGHTILHIAHKLESIQNYDRVVVMAAGEIVNVYSAEEYIQTHQHQPQP